MIVPLRLQFERKITLISLMIVFCIVLCLKIMEKVICFTKKNEDAWKEILCGMGRTNPRYI